MASSEHTNEERPATLKTTVLSALLGFVGVSFLLGVAFSAMTVVSDDFVWGGKPLVWSSFLLVHAVGLLIGGAALWGLMRLRPKNAGGQVSPATRRTNRLFGLSGAILVLGMLALVYGANAEDPASRLLSNSPVSPGVALFVIASFLLSMAIAWWWYFSADEHERRANDVGFLAGGGVFLTVTPVWWVASRAGLLPPPDAMILWLVTNLVIGIGWLWHRSR